MKILLDTHVFIWWDSDPSKLSPRATELIQNQENIILLSVASVWEMQIKLQLGKLNLELPLSNIIESQQQVNNLTVLPIHLEHVLALEDLPSYHKDPFDRLIIAQANQEEATIISADQVFSKYSTHITW